MVMEFLRHIYKKISWENEKLFYWFHWRTKKYKIFIENEINSSIVFEYDGNVQKVEMEIFIHSICESIKLYQLF